MTRAVEASDDYSRLRSGRLPGVDLGRVVFVDAEGLHQVLALLQSLLLQRAGGQLLADRIVTVQ